MYFVGVGIYKLVINKVVDRDLFISILATFGISILFMQLMNFAFGADVVLANSDYGTTMLFDSNVVLPNSKIFSAFISILFALIAYGMALQWGVMNIINIAQGDLVILGGYIAYFMYLYGIHPAWGVIFSPIIMYFVGIGIYKLVINKVVDRDLFISILATFGISILFMLSLIHI